MKLSDSLKRVERAYELVERARQELARSGTIGSDGFQQLNEALVALNRIRSGIQLRKRKRATN